MARIPDEVVNRLKTDVSLLRLVESSGVELKKHGKDWLGRCPFHQDKTPSLVISPESNLWHCLGACNAGGSVIDWAMKSQGVSFRLACEALQADAGLVTGEVKAVKQGSALKLPSPLAADASEAELMQQVVTYYHSCLLDSPEALAYLEKRGLRSEELINTFQLGYANRSLGYRLPDKNRKAGAEIRGKLQALGIVRESGHEHFNGSLVVPVKDALGQVVEIYGRKINDNLREGTAYHLYLPGPHAGVWNRDGLQGQTEVILCESLMDAMTFWVQGFKNVTSSYGVNGFTTEHLTAFKQFGIQRILIAYDRDEAGDKAALSLAAQLQAEGFDCFRVLFPKGMDANDYALKMTPPRKALEVLIRKAEWLGAGNQPTPKTTLDAVKTAPIPPPPSPESVPAAALLAAETAFILVAETAAALAAKEKTAPLTTAALPASPLPASPATLASDITCEVTEQEALIGIGPRQYRVRGLPKNLAYDSLKVNVRVADGTAFHVDTFDLYSARQRASYVVQAANELRVKEDVIKTDLGKLLLQLEALQDAQIKQTLAPKPVAVAVTETEREAALAWLRDPQLLNRVLDDFKRAGVVGEETNKLVGYLACVSRKLEKPLAVMIQSTSAAGKSSLMEAILAFMPEEERVQYSAMTGQSLFYMGEKDLKHKILAIAEEEGAHHASYALKLLQSEGEVTIASTGKDEATGNLVTKEYKVEGPTQLFMTTTAIDLDEELLNRCLVLSVDEGREQTRAIHQAQRQKRTLAGLQAKLEQERVIQLHRTAQRLIRPLAIINPYADQLTFLDDKTRTRRDHEKYLTLIDAIALLHQHQREIKRLPNHGKTLEYIEVQLSDIAAANRLAHEVLGRTLDELPPQTRRLLTALHELVRGECQRLTVEQRDYRFSRKVLLETMGWTYDQVRVHLARLINHEYVLTHRGGRGQSFEYELLYQGEGDQNKAFLMGLIDADSLKNKAMTLGLGGEIEPIGGALGGHRGADGASIAASKTSKNTEKKAVFTESDAAADENASGLVKTEASYPYTHLAAASSLAAIAAEG